MTDEILKLAEAYLTRLAKENGYLYGTEDEVIAWEKSDAANPATIKQLVELVRLQHEALENSLDCVQQEFDEDWRHGLPTRAKQLDGMREMLDKHKEAIAAYEAFEKGEG